MNAYTRIDFYELIRVTPEGDNSMGFFKTPETVGQEAERLNALNNGATYIAMPRSFRD